VTAARVGQAEGDLEGAAASARRHGTGLDAQPPLQHIFGTAALSPTQLVVIAPFPVVVWGADELVRWARRRRLANAD